ncbi:hypothetical protein [Trichodesmium erythraeum]|uniref:hypothetical protein n=1 Tax=Trichodesmium erythraeum TaxID=1206 RepID=UPI0002D71BF8|nr:hypothetical protein [Trichodesmium sp. St5_bin8]MDT9341420.1 hypothetical protein [Trichodesmium erythraeum 21-75]
MSEVYAIPLQQSFNHFKQAEQNFFHQLKTTEKVNPSNFLNLRIESQSQQLDLQKVD